MYIFTKICVIIITKKCDIMFKLQKGYDEYVTKTFRLPKEFVEELEKLAFENNLSLNQLVIQCLNYALDNLDTAEKDKK